MVPRNNDTNPNYKKACPTAEEDDSELDVTTFVPSLLHKKHKVVKLVRSQMKKIQEEGLLNYPGFSQADENQINLGREKRSAWIPQAGSIKEPMEEVIETRNIETRDIETRDNETNKGFYVLFYLLAIILSLLLIILLAVWISAGPLSNPMAYTPIPPGSFVRTDGLCSLEKKYLLRWSKPEYL